MFGRTLSEDRLRKSAENSSLRFFANRRPRVLGGDRFDEDGHIFGQVGKLHRHLNGDGATAKADAPLLSMHLYHLVLVVVDDDRRLNVRLVVDQRRLVAVQLQRPVVQLFPVRHLPVGVSRVVRHWTSKCLHVNLNIEQLYSAQTKPGA